MKQMERDSVCFICSWHMRLHLQDAARRSIIRKKGGELLRCERREGGRMPDEVKSESVEKNNSFFRIFHLNLLMRGETTAYIREFSIENNERFELDFSYFHIILTGWSYSEYCQLTRGSTKNYVKNYVNTRNLIRRYLRKNGYEYEVFPYDIFDRRTAILLFPTASVTMPIEKAAADIARLVQKAYEERCDFDPARYQNVTTLMANLHGEECIAPAAAKCLYMKKLSFFDLRTTVLTEAEIERVRKPFTVREMERQLETLQDAVLSGEEPACRERLDALFVRLKNSFDSALCARLLIEMDQMVRLCCESFDLPESNVLESIRMEHCPSVELMWAELKPEIMRICKEAYTRKRPLGLLTQTAVRIINRQYSLGITQREIAQQIGVSAAHLSRTFNKEMGLSVPEYVTRVKMKEAERLIMHTDKKIQEIGALVGISNAQYFSKVFRAYYGVSPGKYKKRKAAADNSA